MRRIIYIPIMIIHNILIIICCVINIITLTFYTPYWDVEFKKWVHDLEFKYIDKGRMPF